VKETVVTGSEEETRSLARRLAARLKGGDVVCLRGPLGSGKTRFVQGLAAGLGFKGRVTSPTFTLVREYQGRKLRLYHVDLFRVAGADLRLVGLEDYFNDPKGVCAIEWPEVGGESLPARHLDVTLEPISEQERRITLAGKIPLSLKRRGQGED